MNTVDLVIKPARGRGLHKSYAGPSSWAEASPRQAVGLMRWRAVANSQPASRFAALQILFGMKPRHQQWLFDPVFQRTKGVDKESRATLREHGLAVLDLIRWAGETEPGADVKVKSFRRFDFQFGTIPVLLRRLFAFRRYYAPSDALSNCSFDEFVSADRAYQTGNLAQLAAVLYRPRSRFGFGKRIEFDSNQLADRTALFMSLDPGLLDLIGSQFYATKLALQARFRYVFPPAVPGAEPKSTKSAGNWLDVVINMVKLDPTKVAEVEQLNVYLALKVLNEQLRQADEMERQLEAAKTKSK